MCPVCMAGAGAIVGGVVSTGEVTALVVTILRKNKTEKNDSKKEQ